MRFCQLAFISLFTLSTSLYANDESGRTAWKQLIYQISLFYSELTQDHWWNRIGDLKLFLGAIPLANKGHGVMLSELGVNRVISLLEPFELEASPWHVPVTPSMWRAVGVQTHLIQVEDYQGLEPAQLNEGIELLHQELSAGNTVYIHCKGGRGRSASVVIGYFMRYHNMTFEQAYDYVKHHRPHIHLNEKQRAPLMKIAYPTKTASLSAH